MKKTQARKSTRFKPELSSVAQLCTGSLKKNFSEDFASLVLSESYTGCSVVVVNAPAFRVGSQLRVKTGALAPLLAEVRWVIPLDENIQKVGFMYLE